jgi:ketosteroid isomerase-like protein
MTRQTMSRGAWLSAMAAVLVLGGAAMRAQGGDADAVKKLELERFQAQEKNDFAALERLLADDLVYTHSSGAVDTKAAYIESLRSGKSKYLRITPEDLKVRTMGDLVLIHGRGQFVLEAMVNGQKGENPLHLSFLDVWQKKNGKWQMIAWQSTRILPPAK